MTKRDDIKKMWRETFGDSGEWTEMFFSRVWREDDTLAIADDTGRILSCLLLQPYAMMFHGSREGMGYICGAMTARRERGRGLMSRLLLQALEESRRRGDMLCALIPAESHLYNFYARKGFSTVFYSRDLRYTALHPFMAPGEFREVDDLYAPAVYDALAAWERGRDGSVMHSLHDFLNILDDTRIDGGRVAAVTDSSGAVAAIGFAVSRGDIAVVTELIGRSHDAEYAVMRILRAHYADLPFKVRRYAASEQTGLTPRAMARVVNPLRAFKAIAAAHPRLKATVRLSDALLPDNSHTYVIDSGEVTVDDTLQKPYTLDVTTEVLTKLLFSAPALGKLVGLPSVRPHISLMLD